MADHDDVIDLGDAGSPAGAPLVAAEPADPDLVELREDDEDALPAHAEVQPDGSVRLPLRYPVTLRFKKGDVISEETHDNLVMRRLTGADMKSIFAARDGSRTAVAIARSARMSETKMAAVFDRMDGSDAQAAFEVVAHFLSNGRKTGR